MDVTIFQAILIGILSYLGTLMSPWLLGCTGGWYTIGRPLVSGMLIGLILGDVRTGILVGGCCANRLYCDGHTRRSHAY